MPYNCSGFFITGQRIVTANIRDWDHNDLGNNKVAVMSFSVQSDFIIKL